jgi:hypothetical protein
MVKLIVGGKGTGKTKTMVDMINQSAGVTKGNIVCIEKNMNLTYSLKYTVRLIDVDEYKIDGYEEFYGFVAGVLAGDYDILEVYIDGILKIGHGDLEGLVKLIERLMALCAGEKTIIMTVSCNPEDLPEAIKDLELECLPHHYHC